MIEDIEHWNGTSDFKRGYALAMEPKRVLGNSFYNADNHFSVQFLTGFNQGIARLKLEKLILENP